MKEEYAAHHKIRQVFGKIGREFQRLPYYNCFMLPLMMSLNPALPSRFAVVPPPGVSKGEPVMTEAAQ